MDNMNERIHNLKGKPYLQILSTDDTKMCVRCDNTIFHMKEMFSSICAKHPAAVSMSTTIAASESNYVPTSTAQAPPAITASTATVTASTLALERESMSTASVTYSSDAKKAKMDFNVNDEVSFFDKKLCKNVPAVITEIVSEAICKIGIVGQDPFHINVRRLTKRT